MYGQQLFNMINFFLIPTQNILHLRPVLVLLYTCQTNPFKLINTYSHQVKQLPPFDQVHIILKQASCLETRQFYICEIDIFYQRFCAIKNIYFLNLTSEKTVQNFMLRLYSIVASTRIKVFVVSILIYYYSYHHIGYVQLVKFFLILITNYISVLFFRKETFI